MTLEENKNISLAELPSGKTAVIKEFRGGRQMAGKLEAMGIAPGMRVIKKNASLMRGPVLLEKGSTRIAIGFGIAQKIIVEPVNV